MCALLGQQCPPFLVPAVSTVLDASTCPYKGDLACIVADSDDYFPSIDWTRQLAPTKLELDSGNGDTKQLLTLVSLNDVMRW